MQHWGMTGEVQALDMLQQYLTNLMMKWLSSDRRLADGALWSIEDMILFKGEEDVFYQVEFPLFEFQFRMTGQRLQDGRRAERIRWTWSFEIVSRRINRFVSGVSASSLPSCGPRSPGTELLVFPLSLHFLAKSLVVQRYFFFFGLRSRNLLLFCVFQSAFRLFGLGPPLVLFQSELFALSNVLTAIKWNVLGICLWEMKWLSIAKLVVRSYVKKSQSNLFWSSLGTWSSSTTVMFFYCLEELSTPDKEWESILAATQATHPSFVSSLLCLLSNSLSVDGRPWTCSSCSRDHLHTKTTKLLLQKLVETMTNFAFIHMTH